MFGGREANAHKRYMFSAAAFIHFANIVLMLICYLNAVFLMVKISTE